MIDKDSENFERGSDSFIKDSQYFENDTENIKKSENFEKTENFENDSKRFEKYI